MTYVSGVGLDLQVYGSEQDHPETASEKADRRRQLFDLPKSEHDEPPFVILCVAELNANKNQKQLIEALGQLGSQAGNIHLAFAGTGPFEQTLLELANRLGVSDRVHMLGYRRDIRIYSEHVMLLHLCLIARGYLGRLWRRWQ